MGATIGQLAVNLSLEQFSTDMDVVDIVSRFAKELGVYRASQAASKCYKLDEVIPWIEWAEAAGSTSTTTRK